MELLRNIFGKRGRHVTTSVETAEPIVPVPIPSLVTLLFDFETKKGAPLTEAEVIDIRDRAVCMTMRISMRDKLAEQRGYVDIDLENPWPEWQTVRRTLDIRPND